MSGSISGGNVIGSGSDSIVLKISEDQSQGEDAQFTVNVDGQQIGGVQTATASHSAGQDQTFTFLGNYAPGQHNVTVTFVNNFQYPGTSGDRNLFVDGVTYDGQTVSNSTTPIYNSPLFPPNSWVGDIYGNAVYSVNDTTSTGGASNATTTPGAVSIGSGSDTIVLKMAEDPYQGDAQFTVSVDGKQIGGTQTTTAVAAQGQAQEFDVHGDFGGGSHTVTVNYLNDQIGGVYPAGTQLAPNADPSQQWALDTEDRNLYVMNVSMNGGPSDSKAPWELSSSGPADFSVSSGGNQNVGSAQASGSQDTSSQNGSQSGTQGGTQGSGGTTGSTTSDTASISSDTLNAGQGGNGSSSGMSFVSPSTDTSASGSSGQGTPSGSSSGSDTTTADTTSSAIAGSSGSGTSTQDFTVPVSSGTGSSDTSTSGGSGGNWHWHTNSGQGWSGWQHAQAS